MSAPLGAGKLRPYYNSPNLEDSMLRCVRLLAVSLPLVLPLSSCATTSDAPRNTSRPATARADEANFGPVQSLLFWTPEQQVAGYRNIDKLYPTRRIEAGDEPYPLTSAPRDFSKVRTSPAWTLLRALPSWTRSSPPFPTIRSAPRPRETSCRCSWLRCSSGLPRALSRTRGDGPWSRSRPAPLRLSSRSRDGSSFSRPSESSESWRR